MIVNYSVPAWKRNLWDAQDQLSKTYGNLTQMAAWLRDVNIDIWTESPSDDTKLTQGRSHFSLEGWRNFFRVQFNALNAYNTAQGTNVQAYDAGAKAAID